MMTQPETGSLGELEQTIERARAEQAETWEKLAYLSHKINNPLTSLLGRAQLLKNRPHTDPYVQHAAEVIEESSARIAEHLRELTDLVRQKREATRT